MSLRTITVVAATLSLLSSVAFAQGDKMMGGKMMGGKMGGGKMMAGKMAGPMTCKTCKKSYCEMCSAKMKGKDKMGHKMVAGGSGKCANCGMEIGKMGGGKMGEGKMMHGKMGGDNKMKKM